MEGADTHRQYRNLNHSSRHHGRSFCIHHSCISPLSRNSNVQIIKSNRLCIKLDGPDIIVFQKNDKEKNLDFKTKRVIFNFRAENLKVPIGNYQTCDAFAFIRAISLYAEEKIKNTYMTETLDKNCKLTVCQYGCREKHSLKGEWFSYTAEIEYTADNASYCESQPQNWY